MRTDVLLDRNEKKIIAYSEQDVEPILDHNKLLRSQPQKSDWGRHVATVPNVILTKWLNDEYQRGNTSIRMNTPEWNALVERKLNDPEWSYLRVDGASAMLGFGS